MIVSDTILAGVYVIVLRFIFILFNLILLTANPNYAQAQNWWAASREPVGLAPDPALTPEAVVQVYGARAFSWRGYLGIHTWIAVKPTQAKSYTIYEVIGWLQRRKMPVLVIYENVPDRRWYGNVPELLMEKRGDGVDALIERIDQAARSYPYAKDYTIWPGPNSNTFTAWISRAVRTHNDCRQRQSVRLSGLSLDFASTQRQWFQISFLV